MPNPKKRRALVVIDVQNEYIDGEFRIEYPPVSDSLEKIAQAMDAAQDEGIPVVVVQHVLSPNSPIFAEGTRGVELHGTVSSRPRDVLITKVLPSVFSSEEFVNWLDRNEIGTIAIAGYMSHNCNDSTAREAFHRGFDVEVISDAAGSLPYKNDAGEASAEELYRISMVVMASAYAAVINRRLGGKY